VNLLLQLRRKLTLMLAVAVAVYLAIVLYADGAKVLRLLRDFPWLHLAGILGLVLVGYGLRWLRWAFYLRELGIPCSRRASLRIFFSGLAMVITPGKIGELLKSFLLREENGTPLAVSSPVVVAERLTDLLALVLLALGGLLFWHADPTQALLGLGVCLAGIVLVSWRRLTEAVFRVLEALPLVRRLVPKLREFHASSYRLLRPRPLLLATALGVAGWACECIGLFVAARGIQEAVVTPVRSIFIFATGTLAGVVSPGGLGVTDAFLVQLLEREGLSVAAAAGTTLVIRACTLWFAVVVGCVVLLLSGAPAADGDWEKQDTPRT
jgi:glycosyltransferase 2 family protein